MQNRSSFQRDVLYVLSGFEKPNGLQIKKALEEYRGKEINHGRLYPNLDELVDDGLVEKGTIDKRTNYYQLTEKGRAEIEEREEWESNWLD